ncbi:uncharacterized protein LOC105225258 isoform X1 [Bactrocera dorsalis]|uniref:Uncharacterized protein LOC105225258 isoform X1 n=1 Tax=Bactrocera dorsalis TaxID=27457 RepID=A0A6I9VF58_BACDO|nr:uncharacterized protein LOC105225258 isoform X1 [Bactrocera dorsalis]
MNTTSRTGLVPAKKRNFVIKEKRKKSTETLLLKFEASPVVLSLRPLGGLYNPFAKGCSVLCNHPAPPDLKNIISQMKTSLTVDGKSVQLQKDKNVATSLHDTDNIPEDLFRRYTDTDSRPLTPTPTVTSVHTRNSTSSFLNNRRCITPELGKNEIIKRKKIILDLRRTHSQETLYWKPSSDMSQSNTDTGGLKPKSAGANEERKSKHLRGEELRPNTSLGNVQVGDGVKDMESVDIKKVKTCINEQHIDDEDIRRGKKRKKLKPTTTTTATFHLSEDPETQVAALGPDSLNPSTRPSLIPNVASLLPSKEKRESEPILLKGSFLTDEAFQALKTELDIDVIENTFDKYLNHALREAFKYLPEKKPKPIKKAVEKYENPAFTFKAKLPRKLSKSATRFDVPLDPKLLEEMTVLGYLGKYVWVSDQRKQLFKRVFLQYLPTEVIEHDETTDNMVKNDGNAEDDSYRVLNEYVERKIPVSCFPKALEDVLEFYGTEQKISKILHLIEYENEESSKEIDFRTWCGVVSFAERLALENSNASDSCDELEKADFGSLEERLPHFSIPEKLLEIFKIIRSTHNV